MVTYVGTDMVGFCKIVNAILVEELRRGTTRHQTPNTPHG
jgi:hypothetical protein